MCSEGVAENVAFIVCYDSEKFKNFLLGLTLSCICGLMSCLFHVSSVDSFIPKFYVCSKMSL